MRVLDLFCGAGGAAVGYHRAGFDEIVGVDIKPQPNYPFEFIQADVMNEEVWAMVCAHNFDLIHASPPCQAYSVTRHSHTKQHPDLLAPTREAVRATGMPWIIENVVGAPMPSSVMLCATVFDLSAWDERTEQTLWLRRHRLFESSFPFMVPPCQCREGKAIGGVYDGGPGNRNPSWNRGGYTPSTDVQKALMGIDWMTRKELTQAIPPAYTEYIGRQFIEQQVEVA